jgi:hypothetical protein
MIGWAIAIAAAVVGTIALVHSSPSPAAAKKPANEGPPTHEPPVYRLWVLTQYTDQAHYNATDSPIDGDPSWQKVVSSVDQLYAGYWAQGLRNFIVYANSIANGKSMIWYARADPSLPYGVGPTSSSSDLLNPAPVTLLPLLPATPFPGLGHHVVQTEQPLYANATYVAKDLQDGYLQADVLYDKSGYDLWKHGIVFVDPNGLVVAQYRSPTTPPDVLPGYIAR